ncbi:MAG: choice-of-anchor tandem repeat NxxGxxAF-containing protein [Planctomycetota bacterium]
MPPARSTTPAIALALAATPAAADITTVALSGQQVPDANPGVVFDSFYTPVLNADRQIAFTGFIDGPGVVEPNDQGIYSGRPGELREVVRAGSQAPSASEGMSLVFLDAPFLNADGQITFRSYLAGPGVTDPIRRAAHAEHDGTLVQLAREGGSVPDAGPAVVFDSSFYPFLQAGSQTAFEATLLGRGVTESNNRGIYSDRAGMLREIARTGDPVPDAETGVVFEDFQDMAINAAGQIVFYADVTGTGVNGLNDTGIYSDASGTLREVIRDGSQAPDADEGVTIRGPGRFVLNTAGNTAFVSGLNGPGVTDSSDIALFSDRTGTLRQVIREGTQAPDADPGVLIGGVSSVFLNAAGQIAFNSSRLTGPGVTDANNEAAYSDRTGTLREVVRWGDQAPGADAGVVFKYVGISGLNEAGQLLIGGVLEGPGVTQSNLSATYATALDGQITKIIRRGDLLDVNDDPLIEDLRTVLDYSLYGGSSEGSGQFSSFNDLGQITFTARFTDGTSGVFISNAVANLALVFADLDNDGDADIDDLNLLAANLNTGTTPDEGDLDADGDVDFDDLTAFLELLDTVPGDANLDGQVNTLDLAILAANFDNAASPTYALADFNLDQQVNTLDLAILAANFGFDNSSPLTTAATPLVPEPATLALLTLAGLATTTRRRN